MQSTSEREILKRRLFDDNRIANISWSRGDVLASAEAEAAEINKAIAQIEAGDFELIEDFDD